MGNLKIKGMPRLHREDIPMFQGKLIDLGEAKPRASTNAKIKATLFPYHFSFLSETPELLTLGENVSRPGNFLDRSEVNTPRHFRV